MPHKKQTNLQMNMHRHILKNIGSASKSQSCSSVEQSLVRDQMAGGSMLNSFQSLLEAPK